MLLIGKRILLWTYARDQLQTGNTLDDLTRFEWGKSNGLLLALPHANNRQASRTPWVQAAELLEISGVLIDSDSLSANLSHSSLSGILPRRHRRDVFVMQEFAWKFIRTEKPSQGLPMPILYSVEELRRHPKLQALLNSLLQREAAKTLPIVTRQDSNATSKLLTQALPVLQSRPLTREFLASVPHDSIVRPLNDPRLAPAPLTAALSFKAGDPDNGISSNQYLRPPRSQTLKEAARHPELHALDAPALHTNIHECCFEEDPGGEIWNPSHLTDCNRADCPLRRFFDGIAAGTEPENLRHLLRGFAVPNARSSHLVRALVENTLEQGNFDNDLRITFNMTQLRAELRTLEAKENATVRALQRNFLRSLQIARETTRRQWATAITVATANHVDALCRLHKGVKMGCHYTVTYKVDGKMITWKCDQMTGLTECTGLVAGLVPCGKFLCRAHSPCDTSCTGQGPLFKVADRYLHWEQEQGRLFLADFPAKGTRRTLTAVDKENLRDFPDDNFAFGVKQGLTHTFKLNRGCFHPSLVTNKEELKVVDYYPANYMKLNIHAVGWAAYRRTPVEPFVAMTRSGFKSAEEVWAQVYDIQWGLNMWWKRKVHERLGVAASCLLLLGLSFDTIEPILANAFIPPRRFWSLRTGDADCGDTDIDDLTFTERLQQRLVTLTEEEFGDSLPVVQEWLKRLKKYFTNVELIQYQPSSDIIKKAVDENKQRLVTASYQRPCACLDANGNYFPDETKQEEFYTRQEWTEQLRATKKNKHPTLRGVQKTMERRVTAKRRRGNNQNNNRRRARNPRGPEGQRSQRGNSRGEADRSNNWRNVVN